MLDEADRLLDEGFADELTRVLALLPDRRQNLLFSATFPAAVQSLAELFLRDPVRIDVVALLRPRRTFNSAPSLSIPSAARNCCVT